MNDFKVTNLSSALLRRLDEIRGDRSYNAFLCDHFNVERNFRRSKYPYSTLKVGESFLVEIERPDESDFYSPTYNRLRSSKRHYEKKLGRRFSIEGAGFGHFRVIRLE